MLATYELQIIGSQQLHCLFQGKIAATEVSVCTNFRENTEWKIQTESNLLTQKTPICTCNSLAPSKECVRQRSCTSLYAVK